MASKDDKGREDLDDLGLKDRVLFPLTLRFSDEAVTTLSMPEAGRFLLF